MLGVAEIVDGLLRYTDPDLSLESCGVRTQRTATSLELSRDRIGDAVYYRLGYGRLEWGVDLEGFVTGSALPAIDPGALLLLVEGYAAAPDAVPIPGVQRLSVGTTVRLDAAGVTVTRRPAPLPANGPGLVDAVGAALRKLGPQYSIAYSGGVSSAFLAACALSAGHRPQLIHADFGPLFARKALSEIRGLEIQRIRTDLSELLDRHRFTGPRFLPPLLDTEVPRLLADRLAEANHHVALVSGGLLEDVVSARLPEVSVGTRGWRLLACEPFHIAGTLGGLAEARVLLGKGVVYVPNASQDAQPVAATPPPSPTGGSRVPGLTDEGKQALESAHRAAMAVWKEHLDALDPVLGRVVAGIEQRGHPGIAMPALDPGVIAAAGALPVSKIANIRQGSFRNHRPLYGALAALGVKDLRQASPAFRLRLGAIQHLHREREKIVRQLSRECALADLGLVRPQPLINILRDGTTLAANALPLLRLVWVDQWLRDHR
ncbi:hypothetical protein Rhe02_69770 [Rhizocola hellebori]|uniref:Asparagine synthase n=1 Tax=Rhizocola hellebori TaxID=1392758 RepID=A0A8J3QDS2_9ACTN|nr:hypothetical protein [Rhizocola hellebori]GIH08910.1 hypothetical protein Rhe02_69770 [Rhizocola hellebori]